MTKIAGMSAKRQLKVVKAFNFINNIPNSEGHTVIPEARLDCENPILPLNGGQALPCKGWTSTAYVRLRNAAVQQSDLLTALGGAVVRVARYEHETDPNNHSELVEVNADPASPLGNRNIIRFQEMGLGNVRSIDSGVSDDPNSCSHTLNSIEIRQDVRLFYVNPYQLNFKFCPKDFIGTSLQRFIGNRMRDFNVLNFQNTDIYDLIMAEAMVTWGEFISHWAFMAVRGSSTVDAHGDYGFLAKIYFAARDQKFWTEKYDLSGVINDGDYIQSLVNGSKYDASPSDFSTPELYLANFVEWLNTRIDGRGKKYYDASFSGSDLYVVHLMNYSYNKSELTIVTNDGTLLNWLCIEELDNKVVPEILERNALANDRPLIFPYENIDHTNFIEYFTYRLNEYEDNLMETGLYTEYGAERTIVLCDPRMLTAQTLQKQLRYIKTPSITSDVTDVTVGDIFYPCEAFRGKGIYLMTKPATLLLLDDNTNYIENMASGYNVYIDASGQQLSAKIVGDDVMLGTSFKTLGVIATNLMDAPWINHEGLDAKFPDDNARLSLNCYDTYCEPLKERCSISVQPEIEAAYNDVTNVTTFSVDINAYYTKQGEAPVTLGYNWSWNTSDGSRSTVPVTTDTLQVDLPGDRTANSNFTIIGNVTSTSGAETCTESFVKTVSFGNGDGSIECDSVITYDTATVFVEDELVLNCDIYGTSYSFPFVNDALNLEVATDHPAIEQEIQAILNTLDVEIELNGTIITIKMNQVSSMINNIQFTSSVPGSGTPVATRTC